MSIDEIRFKTRMNSKESNLIITNNSILTKINTIHIKIMGSLMNGNNKSKP